MGQSRFEPINGVPWEPVPGREGIEIRSNVDISDRVDEPKRSPEPEEKDIIRRRACIKQDEVMEFGGTPGCPGRTAANRGMRRNHSDTCRKRMDGFMAISTSETRIRRIVPQTVLYIA